MADPITLAVVGAGLGAAMNPNDPLKGAVIGGIGGAVGGSALGGAGATGSTVGTSGAVGSAGAAEGAAAAAGATPAATQMYASTIPGLTSAAPGSQAAYLAAQTAEFGIPGLTATGSAASTASGVSPLTKGMWDAANSLSAGKPSSQMSIAEKLVGRSGERGKNAPPVVSRPATGMRLPVGQQLNYAAPVQGLLNQSLASADEMEKRRRMISLI